jgi:SnoaL-like domain
MTTLQERVSELERTVRNLSDQLELFRLTASYAPSVDSGNGESTANLWIEDGTYHTDVGTYEGREEIAAMVRGAANLDVVKAGSGHMVTMPRLTINGDQAVGVCHALLFVKEGDGYRPWRVSANRWDYVRTPAGWRVKRRTNQLLDASEKGRQIFGTALEE